MCENVGEIKLPICSSTKGALEPRILQPTTSRPSEPLRAGHWINRLWQFPTQENRILSIMCVGQPGQSRFNATAVGFES